MFRVQAPTANKNSKQHNNLFNTLANMFDQETAKELMNSRIVLTKAFVEALSKASIDKDGKLNTVEMMKVLVDYFLKQKQVQNAFNLITQNLVRRANEAKKVEEAKKKGNGKVVWKELTELEKKKMLYHHGKPGFVVPLQSGPIFQYIDLSEDGNSYTELSHFQIKDGDTFQKGDKCCELVKKDGKYKLQKVEILAFDDEEADDEGFLGMDEDEDEKEEKPESPSDVHNEAQPEAPSTAPSDIQVEVQQDVQAEIEDDIKHSKTSQFNITN